MIIKDFKKARKFTSLEAICGKYVFHVFATNSKVDIAVFDASFRTSPLYFFQLRPSFDALILDLGDGLTVSFNDNNDFISCMQTAFDDCPSDDIRSIFETMFYID